MGYFGLAPSVAIKFDIFDPFPWLPVSQTGLITNGADPQNPSIDLLPSGIDLTNQHPFLVSMEYDGTTLDVTIEDTVTLDSASQSYTIDIPSVIGSNKAFVGFTAATGTLTSVQDVLSWNYQSLDSDVYSLTVNAGDTLVVSTSTPAGGPGEFVNGLDPIVIVYDSDGNALHDLTGLVGGTYYIQVSSVGSTKASTLSRSRPLRLPSRSR